jgi:ferredoxin
MFLDERKPFSKTLGKTNGWPFEMKEVNTDVSGKYSVNDGCIGCAICSEIAPNNFRFDHEQGCGHVCKQPDTVKEERRCVEAMDVCPVSAIEVAGDKSR